MEVISKANILIADKCGNLYSAVDGEPQGPGLPPGFGVLQPGQYGKQATGKQTTVSSPGTVQKKNRGANLKNAAQKTGNYISSGKAKQGVDTLSALRDSLGNLLKGGGQSPVELPQASQPVQDEKTGMSTGTKVIIGVGVVIVLFIAYKALTKNK